MTRRTIALIPLLVTFALTILAGAPLRAESPATQKSEAGFARADIKLILDDSGNVVNRTKQMNDPQTVARLAAFFPGMGTGKKSKVAGGWIANVQIDFVAEGGRVVTVTSNYEVWAERNSGDHPMASGLRDLIQAMFK